MGGLAFKKNDSTFYLTDDRYINPNSGTMRLCIRDNNGNIIRYGFTSNVSASQYSPNFYINGTHCFLGMTSSDSNSIQVDTITNSTRSSQYDVNNSYTNSRSSEYTAQSATNTYRVTIATSSRYKSNYYTATKLTHGVSSTCTSVTYSYTDNSNSSSSKTSTEKKDYYYVTGNVTSADRTTSSTKTSSKTTSHIYGNTLKQSVYYKSYSLTYCVTRYTFSQTSRYATSNYNIYETRTATNYTTSSRSSEYTIDNWTTSSRSSDYTYQTTTTSSSSFSTNNINL